jgi:hypothetical protein
MRSFVGTHQIHAVTTRGPCSLLKTYLPNRGAGRPLQQAPQSKRETVVDHHLALVTASFVPLLPGYYAAAMNQRSATSEDFAPGYVASILCCSADTQQHMIRIIDMGCPVFLVNASATNISCSVQHVVR